MDKAGGLILHDYFGDPDGGGRLCRILSEGLGYALAGGFIVHPHPYFPKGTEGRDLGWRSDIPLWRQLKLAQGFARHMPGDMPSGPVIYSGGAYAPLAVHGFAGRLNVLYCHTPPRFIYDLREFYRQSVPVWQRPLLDVFVGYLRPRYEAAVHCMDVVVANSENVRKRIQRYLGRDARVVHPPCAVESFRWLGQGDYFLSTARLDGAKRVELIVRAFMRMPGRRLVVASDGAEGVYLRKLAVGSENIEFAGRVDDGLLVELMGNALATIYIPMDEDFGMSPVESMAAGKPVLTVAEGGPLETVVQGETGWFISGTPSVEALVNMVEGITAVNARSMRGACEARAALFTHARFLQGMRDCLVHPKA